MAQQNLTLAYQTAYATAQTSYGLAGAKALVAIINNNNVAQTATIAAFDGAQQLCNLPALSAGQIVTFPPPGLPVASGGLGITVSGAAPTGGGFLICYRTTLG
jgi:hypothetical protein